MAEREDQAPREEGSLIPRMRVTASQRVASAEPHHGILMAQVVFFETYSRRVSRRVSANRQYWKEKQLYLYGNLVIFATCTFR